jgi:NADH:ubiquinone oxidoreductase subunit F (NADH-binding)
VSRAADASENMRIASTGLPRVFAGPQDGGAALETHLETFGPLPVDLSAEQLLMSVDASGVLGRGGGGFPLSAKLCAVASGRGPRVVVANGAEGEPLSHKDALLLSERPHLVLDGAELAAIAVGADEIIIAVDHSHTLAVDGVEEAIQQRSRKRRASPRLRIARVPSHYVAGEESALVHFLNGGDAKPTFVPPRPYERGVRGRPTLVSNVETLAQLALIARYGSDWYRSLGDADEPGSALLTVSGVVARPGVLEIPLGTPVSGVVAAAGGLTEDCSAVLIGGYFGTWFRSSDAWELQLSQHALREAGAGLGCGVVHFYPAHGCGLADASRIATWMAEESAGQCGPCVFGLTAIAEQLQAFVDGRARERALQRVARWVPQVVGRGACRYPDGAARFVTSALAVFADDVEVHRTRGGCPHVDEPPRLPLREPRDRTWR